MWSEEWRALKARISALREAGEFYFATTKSVSVDWGNAAHHILIPTAQDTFNQLREFFHRHAELLPPAARRSLGAFIWRNYSSFLDSPTNAGLAGVQTRFLLLVAFASEFDFYVSDNESVVRSIVDRAFLHLQRSIVVDSNVAGNWQTAFTSGEVTCERLGSVHLLSHGIWAFKAHGEGERTDLVFQAPVPLDSVERAGATLVLTEWKIATPRNAPGQLQQALIQARRYGSGILGDVELHACRYLILVTEDYCPLPPDHEHEGIVYRAINIAVRPSPPSKARPAGSPASGPAASERHDVASSGPRRRSSRR